MIKLYQLSEQFLSKYKNKQPNWGTLGFITYKRTYARRIESENRTENWWETIRRVIEGNYNLPVNDPRPNEEIIKEMELTYDLMFNFAILPPGRSLWMSGTEYAKTKGDALINCWFVACRPQSYISGKPKRVSMPFVFLFDQCMKGGGVGFSVENKNVNKIPKVKNYVNLTVVCDRQHKDFNKFECLVVSKVPEKHDVCYRIEDSRQGWCEALKYVIDEHWNPKKKFVNLVIDISDVRPQGEPIKGFGGVASGPNALIELLQFTNSLINSRITGKLSPIDCVDIMNFIGRTVVAGNVRRSAEISLADPDNIEFINMKNWRLPALLDNDNERAKLTDEDIANLELMRELQLSHRWASNNSIIIDYKFDDFEKIAEGINSNGEPGMFNIFMAQNFGRIIDGYNPYADPEVEGQNPCFTGDMKLLTSEGYKTFEELNKCKEIKIINKDGNLCDSEVWCSGIKDIILLKLTNQQVIKCTPDHKFMTIEKEVYEAKDLKNNRIMPYLKEPNNFDIKFVRYGFMQGDGDLGRLKSDAHQGVEANIGKKDIDVLKIFKGMYDSFSDRKIYVNNIKENLIKLGFSSEKLPNRLFPSTYDDWTLSQKVSFIRGCYTANGGVLNNYGRITYKATCKEFINRMQKTLKDDFKINSYITKNKEKLNKFNNGEYLMKESYDLNIQKFEDRVKFYNTIGFIQNYKNKILYDNLIEKSPMVIGIKKIKNKVPVYDFTETNTHWGVVEGFIAHNCGEITIENTGCCNLVEIFPYVCDKLGVSYEIAFELAYKFAKRVTFAKYEWESSKNIVQKSRRVGVSLSGIIDWLLNKHEVIIKNWETDRHGYKWAIFNEEITNTLDKMYKYVKQCDKEYSKLISCNESIKLTTVKPSGTISLLPGVSAGMHHHYSARYIRRIRFNSDDNLIEILKQCGYYMESDVSSPNTIVVEFPVEVPLAKSKNFKSTDNLTIEEQFAIQSLLQTYWADNSVSCTITFKNEERRRVNELLKQYKNIIKSTSLLPYEEHGYKQAPYSPITEEEYLKRIEKIKHKPEELMKKDSSKIIELENYDECASGYCPIK